MPIIPLREQETWNSKDKSRKEGQSHGHEADRLADLEVTASRNLRAKKAMARELIAMGLSEEAANRVLHLNGKPEEELVLDDRGSGR